MTASKMHPEWYPLTNLVDSGHLTYFLSSKQSELPIRRVEEGGDYGHKKEPHYEDMTYGHLSCCVCRNRNKALQEGRRYMFFATEYQGLIQEYRHRVYIVGYYDMTCYHRKQHCRLSKYPCVAVLAGKVVFVRINDAFELTDEVWLRWFKRKIPKTNGRPFVQGIIGAAYDTGLNQMIVREILDHFSKAKDGTEDFIRETRRISEQSSLMALEGVSEKRVYVAQPPLS